MYKFIFVVLTCFFILLLGATQGYSHPEYCPDPGTGCDVCHPTPGTGGWPACTPWTVTATAGSGGSISPSGAVTVWGATSQTFTITPSAGYATSNVIVDGVSVGAVSSYTFSLVNANHTISASFYRPALTITATAGSGGSISPSGAVSVTGGNSQTFTITPSAGYETSDVVVDGSSKGPLTSYTFSNVSANHTISASFFQPVGPPPVADFLSNPLTSTDPYIVSFIDQSTNGPTSWLWDFGDGSKDRKQDPDHVYLADGTYTVTLTVSNNGGSGTISKNLDVTIASCPNSPVDLGGWRQTSIQTAYDNAVDGEIIKVQASDTFVTENLVFDQNKSVTLRGGYDCNFSINPVSSRMSSGSLKISNGSVTIENLIIKYSAASDGATLYAQNCAGCHGDLAVSTKMSATATTVQTAIDSNTGTMGNLAFLTIDEVQVIADALNAQLPPPSPPQTCTSCHGQPPDVGAHLTHATLGFGSVTPICGACHAGATHMNGYADIGIPANFDAKSGPAVPNADDTCSSTRCHGGQMTPNFLTGSIDVNTQCTSCHERSTAQYNGNTSGQHSRHRTRSCTDCHNTGVLQTGHFQNLETTTFEQDPAATVGGGTTRVTSYDAATNRCYPSCHSAETW